jgi:hypothetical protein
MRQKKADIDVLQTGRTVFKEQKKDIRGCLFCCVEVNQLMFT